MINGGQDDNEPALTVHLDNSDGRFTPSRRVMLTVAYRPWWRRVLRLPANQVRSGPFKVHQWPPNLKPGETP